MTIAHSSGGDIAVIGLGCRFPGDAKSPDEFFEMLMQGRNGWKEIPQDRFNIDAFWHPSYDRHGTMVCRGGHFLSEDVGLFDAPFFSFTAGEANAMDPQHRMLLEVTYEALENAGVPMQKMVGSDTACFVGGFSKEYDDLTGADLADTLLYTTTGNGMTMMSNRISWFYDLRGPSMTIDTACSSSLVALHQACLTIRASTSDCRQALVAGTNLILTPDKMTTMNPLHFLSPDSQCFSFDDRANGYVRGEGLGVLLLKHIDDAIRDNDCIRAVIRATSVNQDGKTPGITLPRAEAQQALIEATYRAAGLDPADTTYFEAHGTGTAAGDPLEVGAIASVFDRTAPGSPPLYIGSVKPNIGHLESGAGIAGMIKTILALEKGVIPPNINFLNPNPKLQLVERNFKVPTEPTPWPTDGLRRASVNSFGFGGTNGHCIIDDAHHYLTTRGIHGRTRSAEDTTTDSPTSDDNDSGILLGEDLHFDKENITKKQKLFVLSAPDQAALSRLTTQYADFLKSVVNDSPASADSMLEDLAFTYSDRRSTFKWRTSLLADSTIGLAEGLDTAPKPMPAAKAPSVLFCFTGQGAQWHAMGRELLANDVYLRSVEAADYHLSTISTWSVIEELRADEDKSNINRPEFSQPLCTVIQIALIDLLRHWGITPKVVLGHSSGEIAAAYAMGALSAEECWSIAYYRGCLAGGLRTIAPHLNGGMMAVGLSAEEVQPHVQKLGLSETDTLSIACINSQSSITMSGDVNALSKLEGELKAAGIFARRLMVENAYHSAHMHHLADEYRRLIAHIKPKDAYPGVSMISSVTGQAIEAEALGADYWVENMVNPILFRSAVEAALASKGGRRKRAAAVAVDTIVEIGPHSALQGPIMQILKSLQKSEDVVYASALSRAQSAAETTLHLAGTLWCRGVPVHVRHVNSTAKEPGPSIQLPLAHLPKYPWNHSNRYWHESAFSKGRRFRHAPRTDLLGEPVQEFSWAEPTWKNYLRLSEQPWISDHKVRGGEVFPAAGMICAAIEGIRQLADASKTIHTIELRDVVIGRALIMPVSDPGVKVFTRLKPLRNGTKGEDAVWYEFSFSSLDESSGKTGHHTEHASGLISIAYETGGEIDKRVEEAKNACVHQRYNKAMEDCTIEVSREAHYQSTKDIGFEYGPIFQSLKSAKYRSGEATLVLEITDSKSIMPENFEYPFLLHPSTLDVAIQASFQALEHERGVQTEAMVPTGFKRISVSANIPNKPGSELIGFATATRIGLRDMIADIKISSDGWPTTLLELGQLALTGLGDTTGIAADEDGTLSTRKLGAKTVWKPAPDLLSLQDAQRIYGQDVEAVDENTSCGLMSTKAAAIYIQRALKAVTSDIEAQLSGHFLKFFRWMQERYEAAKSGKLAYQQGSNEDWLGMSYDEEETFLITYKEACPADGKLLCAIGQNLVDILRGVQQPLPLMLEDDMLSKIYTEAHGLKSGLGMFKHWFDLQGHKRPDMKILEVGGGTGSVTLPILEVLGKGSGNTPRFGSYCFTDISSGWFESAQELFRPWAGYVEFKKLDISEDPLDQGFTYESFDVLAASNVLHATPRLDVTLANCFKLLKPGGTLVIGELTWNADHIGLMFGTLPGWWLVEDGRHGGPLITQEDWSQQLQSAGFEWVPSPVAAKDTHGNAKLSMMVARKPAAISGSPLSKITVIEPVITTRAGDAIIKSLHDQYVAAGVPIQVVRLDKAHELAQNGDFHTIGSVVISLVESFDSVFARCSEEEFEQIRSLILLSNRLFWVNCTVSEKGVQNPDSCAISGLLRTAKAENPRLGLYEVHLKGREETEAAAAAQAIIRVVDNTSNATEGSDYENELVEMDGVLQIPRIVDDEPINKVLQSLKQEEKPELQPLIQPGRPLKLDISRTAQLNTLHFVDDTDAHEPLADYEVEIDVKATALNSRDVSISMGQTIGMELGIDAAGVVKNVGSSVMHLQPGDRVAFAKLGSMRTTARVDSGLVQKIPDSMSFERGASVPLVFVAAYQSLVETARLTKGETVLIHTAAGGLGRAMIAIANYLGAEIFVTVGSEEKKAVLVEAFGIAPEHVFNSRSLSFGTGIREITDGRGVDVAINTLAGEALRVTLGCIAPFGRLVNLNLKDVVNNGSVEMEKFLSNVSFATVNIPHMLQHAPQKVSKLLKNVFELVRSDTVHVSSPSVYDYSDMEESFRKHQTGSHIGKVVLSMTEKSIIQAAPFDPHPLQLKSDATYVIVGGLGGLGRGLSIYMAQHGVKHLALFSRTSAVPPEAQHVLDQLAEMGTRAVVYTCDITDRDVLATTIGKLAKDMPPIKGVIQGAMALKDGLFETMPYQNWIGATKPKIEGTWNLHELMPKDLDFFIMLSSISGIVGNRGQSNYSAGNTYQDAMAHYRRSLGLAAQTIDLGAIGGIGWLEENKDGLTFAKTMSDLFITPHEFFTLVKSAITGFSHATHRLPPQLMTGLGSGGMETAHLAAADAGAANGYTWLHESARFAFLRQLDLRSARASEARDGGISVPTALAAAKTGAEAARIVQDAVAAKLAKSMMVAVEDIDVSLPVSAYGVDSLVAAEMRNWCFKELRADVSVFEFLSGVPLGVLAGQIADKSALVPGSARTA